MRIPYRIVGALLASGMVAALAAAPAMPGTARRRGPRGWPLARWMRRISATAAVLIAAAMGGVAVSSPAQASTVSCSASDLISAISMANGTSAGTVTLTSGCTYALTAVNNTTDAGGVGLPVITGNVTIQGNGATITRSAASGTPVFRIFDVASSGSLTLNSVTINNGLADNGQQGGGGILNHGTLTITGSTFTNNSAPSSTGPSGGGINNSGTLNLTTSTFTGNSAQEGGGVFNQKTATITNNTFANNTATIFGGGALLNAAGTMTVTGDTFTGNTGPGGGAIDNDTTLNIIDSTFTGNTGGTNGGGAIINFGPTTVTQSTISGNSSPFGANILNFTGFTLSLSGSIVASGQGGPNCGGAAVTDAGYNIDTGSSCGFSPANHSMSNTNPELGPLASNGGPTQTMALQQDSPAIDAIPLSASICSSTDQRVDPRPDGSESMCDMGAYEFYDPAPLTSKLINTINSFNLPSQEAKSYIDQLQSVLADLNAGNTAQACSDLTGFINHVEAQSGKQLTPPQANQLIAAAEQIQAELACSTASLAYRSETTGGGQRVLFRSPALRP